MDRKGTSESSKDEIFKNFDLEENEDDIKDNSPFNLPSESESFSSEYQIQTSLKRVKPSSVTSISEGKRCKNKALSPYSSSISEGNTISNLNGICLSKSLSDRCGEISLSKDMLTATGFKGYRMVRCTHGVSEGAWYCEALVLQPENGVGNCRLGWSTRIGNLQGPVGYDSHSYGYRDISGSKINNSLRIDNYGESYGSGDVIGMLIILSGPRSQNGIRFYKNGKDQGYAFKELSHNEYCPSVSLYKGGRVRMNFGPSFVYPLPEINFEHLEVNGIIKPKAFSDLYPSTDNYIESNRKWVEEQRK